MLLRGRWIRRITFLVVRPQSMPAYFTFRERLDYQEDPVIRYGPSHPTPMQCTHAWPSADAPVLTHTHTHTRTAPKWPWVWTAAVGTWSRHSPSSWSSSA